MRLDPGSSRCGEWERQICYNWQGRVCFLKPFRVSERIPARITARSRGALSKGHGVLLMLIKRLIFTSC